MNASLDYDVTTCRYAPGSWQHERLLMAYWFARDLQDALRAGDQPWFIASCAMRLWRTCDSLVIDARVTYKGMVELYRGGECVYRMAVHR